MKNIKNTRKYADSNYYGAWSFYLFIWYGNVTFIGRYLLIFLLNSCSAPSPSNIGIIFSFGLAQTLHISDQHPRGPVENSRCLSLCLVVSDDVSVFSSFLFIFLKTIWCGFTIPIYFTYKIKTGQLCQLLLFSWRKRRACVARRSERSTPPAPLTGWHSYAHQWSTHRDIIDLPPNKSSFLLYPTPPPPPPPPPATKLALFDEQKKSSLRAELYRVCREYFVFIFPICNDFKLIAIRAFCW